MQTYCVQATGSETFFFVFKFFLFQYRPFLKSLLSSLQYCFCFMFWCFGCKICRFLAPQRIEPTPHTLEGKVLTTGPPGKSTFFHLTLITAFGGFSYSSISKESASNAGDLGLIPGSGRPPGEGNGNPLQFSCLENPTDRGAWWVPVHGVARVGHN